MVSKTVKVTIWREGNNCGIPVPFDPKAVFGKVRAPVSVTLNGFTYRSTIASMGGRCLIPLRRSYREAAGVEGGEKVDVRIELDTGKRDVVVPPDLLKALKADPAAMRRWADLSYTHRREHVESILAAKKPETRARRIDRAIAALAAAKKQ